MRCFLPLRSLIFVLFLLSVFSLPAQAYRTKQRGSEVRQVGSVWATTPPHLDGVIGKSEWFHAEAGRLQLNHGVLLAQNDASHLYLLIDLTQDTHDDPPRAEAPWGDLLALVF